MADDDSAMRARLAALDAEVKADADAARTRREAALTKAREQRAAQLADQAELRARQAELVGKPKPRAAAREVSRDDDDDRSDLGSALELAGRAGRVKQELARKPQQGEKSWIKSGVASMALGPIGWLYAGSFREAVPAAVAWIALAALASKIIPMFLLMPVLFVALPLSGIAGVVYAIQYNRHGGRQRLFDKDDDKKARSKPKQLRG